MKTKTCYETHKNCNGPDCNHAENPEPKTKRTAGEWDKIFAQVKREAMREPSYTIVVNMEPIADIPPSLNAEANANFICLAVNSHDALVSALAGMLETSSCRSLSFCAGRGAVAAPAMREAYGKHPATPCDCCVCESSKLARAALALAKEGE